MDDKSDYRQLSDRLKSLLAILEIDRNSTIYRDTIACCNFLEKNTFQIAVFAPFNHGKSTLLNALLGQKTLPIDLIPTTGAAISVRYGAELTTKITLKNGEVIIDKGTGILKQYAILDDDRRMKDDVAEVEVFCDNSFLQNGVELIDLPGTNDREEQNDLIKDKLLSVDLIIHVLDARKLMTLEERENLRDWLLDRGIDTVIFVVNFLNLLEPEAQKQVQNRLIFVAESFRSHLPQGISNLYRVDALPALRARLKGDAAAVQTTGLPILETALQTIVRSRSNSQKISLDRIKYIVDRLQQIASEQKQQIIDSIELTKQKKQAKQELKNKAKQLILQGLQRSVSEMESWLYISNLCSSYREEVVAALRNNSFNYWRSERLQSQLNIHLKAISEWKYKTAEIFGNCQIGELQIELPDSPIVVTVELENNSQKDVEESTILKTVKIVDRLANKIIGVTLSEGIDYILDRTSKTEVMSEIDSESNNNEIYYLAAETYLKKLSQTALEKLDRYHRETEKAIESVSSSEGSIELKDAGNAEYRVRLIDGLILQLQEELAKTND